MHPEAFAWTATYRTDDPVSVLDIGGRNINGSVRDLFPNSEFTCLDILPGDGVDIVADAGTWVPDRTWDIVTCAETFEHTANWRDIVRTAYAALRPGGRFIATMAGPGRPPHSAMDGGWMLYPGEHYANVHPDDLEQELKSAGFVNITVDYQTNPCDTRCAANRPPGRAA